MNSCNRGGLGLMSRAWYYVRPFQDRVGSGMTQGNAGDTCASIQALSSEFGSGVYWVTYGSQTPFQVEPSFFPWDFVSERAGVGACVFVCVCVCVCVWCVCHFIVSTLTEQAFCEMSYEGGGWLTMAYAPDRTVAETFEISSDSGTVGDFQGWTTLNAVRTNVNLLITKFRARYVYLEDQVGIPQEGTTFDTYIDFKPSQPSSLSTLTSANMQPDTGSWIAESEGATCNKWYCEC